MSYIYVVSDQILPSKNELSKDVQIIPNDQREGKNRESMLRIQDVFTGAVMFDLMLYYNPLESLNNYLEMEMKFHFAMGPTDYVSGPN